MRVASLTESVNAEANGGEPAVFGATVDVELTRGSAVGREGAVEAPWVTNVAVGTIVTLARCWPSDSDADVGVGAAVQAANRVTKVNNTRLFHMRRAYARGPKRHRTIYFLPSLPRFHREEDVSRH